MYGVARRPTRIVRCREGNDWGDSARHPVGSTTLFMRVAKKTHRLGQFGVVTVTVNIVLTDAC